MRRHGVNRFWRCQRGRGEDGLHASASAMGPPGEVRDDRVDRKRMSGVVRRARGFEDQPPPGRRARADCPVVNMQHIT